MYIVNFIFVKKNLSYLYFTPANLGVYYLYNEKVNVRSSWIKQNHLKNIMFNVKL